MGSTCQCAQKPEELEEWQLQDEDHKTLQQQTAEENDKDNNNPQQDNADIIGSQTEDLDPIQLESYDALENQPDPSFAIPLNLEQEAELIENLPVPVRTVMAKLPRLQIKALLSKNYQKIPHIETPYLLPSQDVYVGQWAKQQPFGIGKIYYQDKAVYEGQVVNLIPDGEGRRIFPDGQIYSGNFKMGEISGNGKLVRRDGFKYDGQWLNGRPHGNGAEIWPDGTAYQGEYNLGKKQGKGTFTWGGRQNKKTGGLENYIGEFVNDLFDGEGKYEWADGRVYEGAWVGGKMEGYGVFTWPDKRIYKGNYIQDYKAGQGTLEWPDGKKLSGQWKLGKLHGVATLVVKDKEYRAEYQDGKRIKWLQETQPSLVNSHISVNNRFDEHNQSKYLPEESVINQQLFQDKQQIKSLVLQDQDQDLIEKLVNQPDLQQQQQQQQQQKQKSSQQLIDLDLQEQAHKAEQQNVQENQFVTFQQVQAN